MFEISVAEGSTFELVGQFEGAEVVAARRELEALIEKSEHKSVNVDLASLETFNSEVLSLCLCLLRRSKVLDVDLIFVNTPKKLADMARVGGVEFIFSS